MWGRRKDESEASVVKSAGVVASPRALSTTAELLRNADWDRLSEQERAGLVSPLQGRQVPVLRTDGAPPEKGADIQLQDWVAQIVGTRFQAQITAVVRSWLDEGAPDGHLYVGGGIGQGRTSLVASLTRAALAQRPVPPEYCYAPDVAALDQPVVLTLAKGTGRAFGRGLVTALGQIGQNWDGDGDGGDDGSNGSDGSGGSGG